MRYDQFGRVSIQAFFMASLASLHARSLHRVYTRVSSTRKRVKLNGSLAQREFKDLNKKTKDAQEKIRRIKSESKQLEARMDLAN